MTTQVKHTPGPWEIGSINKRDKNLWWAAVFTPKSTGKFHIPRACEALGVDREECEGNARLIASAPELLEALKTLKAIALRISDLRHNGQEIDDEDWSTLYNETIEARELIAKTEGERRGEE